MVEAVGLEVSLFNAAPLSDWTILSPFVLSLSKHRSFSYGAKKVRPFDKLRANGEGAYHSPRAAAL